MSSLRTVSFWVTLGLCVLALGMLLAALPLNEAARGFPMGVAGITLLFCLTILLAELSPRLRPIVTAALIAETASIPSDERELAPGGAAGDTRVLLRDIPWRLVSLVFGSVLAYAVGVLLLGFTIATPLYGILFARLYGGASWKGSLLLAAGGTLGILGMSVLLKANLFPGLIGGANIPPF